MPESGIPDEFSTAFEKLVRQDSADEDIIGLLAYSLYKRDKRDLVLEGRLSAEHLRQHHKTLTPGLIDQHREGALRRLETYSAEVVRRVEPDIRGAGRIEAVEAAKDEIIDAVRANTRWWLAIILNVVAWLIFTRDHLPCRGRLGQGQPPDHRLI